MKDIIILGAGGSAMDIVSIIEDINKISPRWNLLGYLDDNKLLNENKIADYKVLGTIDDCVNYPDAYYISSIAHPKNRKVRSKVFNRVAKHRFKFATIIHPTSTILKGVILEDGVIVKANCVIGAYAHIHIDVFISNGTVVSHESDVLSHTTLATGVKISSGVKIGESCYIGCGVSTTHDIVIDSDITLGVGSVVVSDVKKEKGNIWVGVPAKPLQHK